MNIRVFIDIDDTLVQLLPAWIGWLNKKYNLDVDYNEITNWNVAQFFPTLTREQVYEPLASEEIWQMVKPMPDSQEYLEKLQNEGYEIYLVTATDYRNVYPKFEYVIKKYYPFIKWNQIIVASNKQLLKGDILIDDAPHNLEGGLYKPLLFTAPHNKQPINSEKFFRVNSWREIYDYLTNYRWKRELVEKYNPKFLRLDDL